MCVGIWSCRRARTRSCTLCVYVCVCVCVCARTHKCACACVRVCMCLCVPMGSPSRGRDVAVYVFEIYQPSLPTTFLFCSCVCFRFSGPFNCISFHKFSRQLSAFSLCFSGLISASLVLLTIYLFMTVSLSPDIILCG